MASSSTVGLEDLFCVSFTKNSSNEKFHLNFVSDSREATSIKLPDFIISLSKLPKATTTEQDETKRMVDSKEVIVDSVNASLRGWFGDKMPRMYMADNGGGLVMRVHIFKEHSEALMKLPFEKPAMQILILLIMKTIHQRVMDVTGKITMPYLTNIEKGERCVATGRRAKWDEISPFFVGPKVSSCNPTASCGTSNVSGPPDLIQFSSIPSSSIKKGEHTNMGLCSDESEDIISVSFTKELTNENFHLNFVSDPREENSLKLPDFMIHITQQPDGTISQWDQYIATRHVHLGEIEEAYEVYLDGLYGEKMPKIYRGQNGKDLVMNVHIFKDHCDILKNRQLWQSMMVQNFFSITLMKIHESVMHVIGLPPTDPGLDLSQAWLPVSSECVPTGKRAKRDEIFAFFTSEMEDDEQLRSFSASSIKVGTPLVCIGFKDYISRRAFYFNVIAHNKPGSIKLPKQMTRLAELDPFGAIFESQNLMKRQQIQDLLRGHVRDGLEKLWKLERPVVYVAKNNEANLVVNVPVHINHARLFPKCLLGFYKTGFYGTITTHYRDYFLRESQSNDLKRNDSIELIFGSSNNQAIGRIATKEEIYSLVLKQKPTTLSCSIM